MEKLGPSRYVHVNLWYKIRQDDAVMPSGQADVYDAVESNNSIYVIAVTEDSKILLVNLYRYTTSTDSWEIIAGHIFVARQLRKAAGGDHQQDEGISNVKACSPAEIYTMLAKEKIVDSPAISALAVAAAKGLILLPQAIGETA